VGAGLEQLAELGAPLAVVVHQPAVAVRWLHWVVAGVGGAGGAAAAAAAAIGLVEALRPVRAVYVGLAALVCGRWLRRLELSGVGTKLLRVVLPNVLFAVAPATGAAVYGALRLWDTVLAGDCNRQRAAVRLTRGVVPAGFLAVICRWMWVHGHRVVEGCGWGSIGVRLLYTALFGGGMEHVARYNHRYLWHGAKLWWVHGTHHRQAPARGAVPVYKHGDGQLSPVLELNDLFPVLFGAVATALLYCGAYPPHYLAKDCWTGVALGTTVYGFAYFVGHDLVAHERLGKRVADGLRTALPALGRCAAVHNKHHHTLTDKGAGNDPYGPPYGFFLGEQEVAAMADGGDYAPMPGPVRATLQAATAVACSSTLYHWGVLALTAGSSSGGTV
jgi:beta-carotene 3-hydroxylase